MYTAYTGITQRLYAAGISEKSYLLFIQSNYEQHIATTFWDDIMIFTSQYEFLKKFKKNKPAHDLKCHGAKTIML